MPYNSKRNDPYKIEGWKNNPPKDHTWHSNLNNFYCYLPSNDYINQGGRLYGYSAQRSGLMDIKNYEYHTSDSAKLHHSNLFLSQTPREFFEEIDKTINRIPTISLKKINRLRHKHDKIAENIRMYKSMPPKKKNECRKK